MSPTVLNRVKVIRFDLQFQFDFQSLIASGEARVTNAVALVRLENATSVAAYFSRVELKSTGGWIKMLLSRSNELKNPPWTMILKLKVTANANAGQGRRELQESEVGVANESDIRMRSLFKSWEFHG
ncbi:hypothetical protein ACOSP7_016681 [Xanthoceras sorbifolium]